LAYVFDIEKIGQKLKRKKREKQERAEACAQNNQLVTEKKKRTEETHGI
jgi:hypothetical protein